MKNKEKIPKEKEKTETEKGPCWYTYGSPDYFYSDL